MSSNHGSGSGARRLITTAMALALAAGVAGCAKDRMSTGSVNRASGYQNMSAS